MLTPSRRLLLGSSLAMLGAAGIPPLLQPSFAREASKGALRAALARELPKHSDVIMTIFANFPGVLDAVEGFRATRCEWLYSTDAQFVAELKKRVGHVGLAISPTISIPGNAGAAREIDGSPMVAPWMAQNKVVWNSIFKPVTRGALRNTIDMCVAAGANSVQFDDAATSYEVLLFAGGDYSPEAIEAFRQYCSASPNAASCGAELASVGYDISKWVLAKNGGDAKVNWRTFKQQHQSNATWQAWSEFSRSNTKSYVASVQSYLHSLAKPIPLTLNINNPLPVPNDAFLLDCADYLISEIYGLTAPRQLISYHACADAWNLPFVPSIVPVTTQSAQWAVALAYALGDNPVVPWNIFVPNQPRYFGTVADFGPLFGFVLDNKQYFDGYESVTDVALVISEKTASPDKIDSSVAACLDQGLLPRLVVLRSNGAVTGDLSAAASPRAAVAVNCTISEAERLFPNIPVISLDDFKQSQTIPGGALRVSTHDTQNIVAVPRISRQANSLLLHVVNTKQPATALNDSQYLDITIPPRYRSFVVGRERLLMIGPGGFQRTQTVNAIPRGEDTIIRVSLAGLKGWGIINFTRGS